MSSAKKYKIAVIPGDGTGPEVVREGLKVLEAVSRKVGFKYEGVMYDFGGERYKKTGDVLPDSALEEFKKACALPKVLPAINVWRFVFILAVVVIAVDDAAYP